jgi:hypothetical protein
MLLIRLTKPLSFITATLSKARLLTGRPKASPPTRNMLFVCGAPRSGTTGLWRLLIQDPRIVLGMERHGSRLRKEYFRPELYEKDHFFDFETYPNLARVAAPYYAQEAYQRFESAVYVGDKLPLLFQSYKFFTRVFPDAKLIVLLRNIFDICESYQARLDDAADNWHFTVADAVAHWNSLLAFLSDRGHEPRVKVIIYEQFLSDVRVYRDLYRFLGLSEDEGFGARYEYMLQDAKRLTQRRAALVSDGQKFEVLRSADLVLYAQLVARFTVRN